MGQGTRRRNQDGSLERLRTDVSGTGAIPKMSGARRALFENRQLRLSVANQGRQGAYQGVHFRAGPSAFGVNQRWGRTCKKDSVSVSTTCDTALAPGW